MNKDFYVLDSSALIAFLRKETGAEIVAGVFKKATEKDCIVYMHQASVAEVYYDTLRLSGKEQAERIFKILITLPLSLTNVLNSNFIKQIGYFKINHKISFADSFVLALASIKKAKVVSQTIMNLMK